MAEYQPKKEEPKTEHRIVGVFSVHNERVEVDVVFKRQQQQFEQGRTCLRHTHVLPRILIPQFLLGPESHARIFTKTDEKHCVATETN